MQEISEKTLLDALNAVEGIWREMPFPEDKIPEGYTAKSVEGNVNDTVFLVVRFTVPGGTVGYDGTCVIRKPFAMIHIPVTVAEAAFLKGTAWLEKQKAGV